MKVTLKDIERQFKNNNPKAIGPHHYFSVLAPFVLKDGKLHLLFEVRSKHMDRQPGEVCFPGGMIEDGESVEEAALRETYEEIGIESEDIKIIGRGNTICDHIGFTLYSVIGIVNEQALQRMVLEKNEVDKVFLVDFQKFIDNPPKLYDETLFSRVPDNFPFDKVGISKDYPWPAGTWRQPVYDVSEDVIWGLTGRVVKDIVDCLTEKGL